MNAMNPIRSIIPENNMQDTEEWIKTACDKAMK